MRKLHGLVALISTLTLAAACSPSGEDAASPSPSPTATSSSPTPEATVDKPSVGECRLEQAADIPPSTNETPTVPCSEPHTAYTAAVLQLPQETSYAGTAVDHLVGAQCPRAVQRATGLDSKTLTMSILSLSWFVPTDAEQEAGARWVRCDVNAYTYDGNTPDAIYELPGLPIKDEALPESLRLCFAGELQPTRVSCSEEHTYRAEAAVRLRTHGDPYPSAAAMRARVTSACALAVGGHADLAWTSPSPDDWAVDQAWVACLTRDAGTPV
jgi:hypothetical protein